MSDTTSSEHTGHGDGESRRDFLYLAAGAMGAVGAGAVAWPFIDSMNPSADTLAISTIEVDLAPVAEGQAITVMWRGAPVFVRHRTEAEIEQARSVDVSDLPDPQTDAERVERPEWMILVGVCTHLGCVPQGQRTTDLRGEFGGWFCSCHGSHYDTSGRIRRGPAPTNLPVPPYSFLTDERIRLG